MFRTGYLSVLVCSFPVILLRCYLHSSQQKSVVLLLIMLIKKLTSLLRPIDMSYSLLLAYAGFYFGFLFACAFHYLSSLYED